MKAVSVIFMVVMLLTLDIAVAADKETTFDTEGGFWGECVKVRVGGETPDKQYFESCWIHFITKGGWGISVVKTEAWFYGYRWENGERQYELGYWSFDEKVDKVYSRDPLSGTFSVKGVCKGYFKSWVGARWTGIAEREVHASDPPIVPAVVFFNVTS